MKVRKKLNPTRKENVPGQIEALLFLGPVGISIFPVPNATPVQYTIHYELPLNDMEIIDDQPTPAQNGAANGATT